MKRLLLLLAVCTACISGVWAQAQTVTGKVVDASTGEPIVGASVVVQGTSTGSITSLDGDFTVECAQGAKLVISFIGLETKVVDAKDGVVVELAENTSALDEVMVVAFGTTTKKSFTGSASVVKSEEIQKRQSSNVTSTLAGSVAGVQGMSSNGQPGEVSSIRIRGIGSMSSSNAPLYVIDGMPADDALVATISNSDIESVTVLKDAASNALYGARGANGVVLITTKRGTSRDAKITVEGKWGSNQRALPNYNVMTSPAMYYEKFYEAMYMSQIANGDAAAHAYANRNLLDHNNGGLGYLVYTIPAGQTLVGTNFKLNPQAVLGYNDGEHYYTPDNWFNELFNTGNLRQEYNLNISGSSDKFNYYASFSYLDDSGLMENSDYKRFTSRVAVDYQAKKWLKIGTNMSYSHADQRAPRDQTLDDASSSGNLFFLSNFMAPIYPLYIRDAEGNIMKDHNGFTMYDYGDATEANFVRAFMNQSNPASAIALDKSQAKNDMFTGNFYATAELYDGLKATAKVALAYFGSRFQQTLNPYYGQVAAMGGQAVVEADRMFTLNQQYLLTYVKDFGAHSVDVLAGYESYNYTTSYVYGVQTKLFNPDIAELGNAILQPATSSATEYYATQGILAQAKYDYDNKYYVSASYRRDGSSRFAPGRRWGNFWSVGAAWDIKSEPWMDAAEQVDLLKVKLSYGAQGNDNLLTSAGYINYYPYADQYTLSENNGGFATTRSYKGNEDITWETSYNLNGGVDFSLFGERFGGTIEGYWRRTEDMLYYKPVAPSLGYSYLPVNVGSISNAGIEIELKGDIIKTKNVTWNIYANVSYNKNKILELDPSLGGEWINGNYIYREGENINQFYIREYAGVNPETGAPQWWMDQEKVEEDADGNPLKDENGNPKYVLDADGNPVIEKVTTESWSNATKYAQGDLLPKVYGGFGTTLNAYGVDFSMAFAYQLGGKIYDNAYASLMHSGYGSAGKNWHTDILNSWTPENTETDVPRVNVADQYTTSVSDRFLVSSNYLSLQNITLGYTLPSKWTKKLQIEKLRVYAVADNVALVSARQGLDPRQSYTSSNSATYSPIRSISGGISVTF